jgi:hypothetical protein
LYAREVHQEELIICHQWDLKMQAGDQGAQLVLIPAGQTEGTGPIERRVSLNLKASANGRFDAVWSRDPERTLSLEDAIYILLKCWDSISQFEVMGAWQGLIEF